MSETPSTDISHDQHAVRRNKLAELRAGGFDPFRANVTQTHFSAEAVKLHVAGQDNVVTVSVAGRLVTIRDMGKSQFVKILDQQGQIQLYVKKDVVGDEVYVAFKKLDLGDFIGATGTLFLTKTGEVTVRVEKLTLVSKALRPLPEKPATFSSFRRPPDPSQSQCRWKFPTASRRRRSSPARFARRGRRRRLSRQISGRRFRA